MRGISETSKYRHLTAPFLKGNGIDVGSGGDPVIPSAIQVELPAKEYAHYRSGDTNGVPIQWQGYAHELPFKDNTLDYVYSSHLLEDFLDWTPCLTEWTRVLKPGGVLLILIPDKVKWDYSVQVLGQTPNCSHRHEAKVGELSTYAKQMRWFVLKDCLTALTEHDYTIMFMAKKMPFPNTK